MVKVEMCAVCGHENPLKYDNFDSLSLHLPQRSTLGQTHSLTGLLEDFVDTEIINEFECEMCNKDRLRNSTVSNDLNSVEDSSSENGGNPTPGSLGNQTSQGIPTRPAKVLCDAVRTLRLGKLPPCLCLHIHRTFYSSHGAYKRQDYVDFPEYLVMDPYTYNAVLREKEVGG
ncbi:ubiquitin carboxyl-terminal hydrolase 30-like [Diaphorina citri]|uniref:ubiquitinyl hydrolase 1 n=1 Tax=Diaphorina citri TaxID=121845 RepID=A0A1S3DAK3_DIACI|nr:ubiquitin carboxyl-terminal hydrolase 30-like [Diaphorina citri]